MLGVPGRLRKDLDASLTESDGAASQIDFSHLSIRAGTYPPPPIAMIRLGWNSVRIFSAEA